MVQHFKNCADNGEYVGCIGMDFSKAFDCLPHRLTICKLRANGTPRSACALLASYLYCWKQHVNISIECSDWVLSRKVFHRTQISTTALLPSSLHLDLVWVNWKKIQERALRFVSKESGSCYDELISKAKVDALMVSAVKIMATEVFNIHIRTYILALDILKIISKEPEILIIYMIMTNWFSQWNLLHPME